MAFHLLRADLSHNEEICAEELRKAKNHCQRAIYDAVEIGIMYYLEQLKIFENDYRTIIIPGVIHDFVGFLKTANEANDFISAMTRLSISDHCNNRGEHYSESTKIFEKLRDNNAILAAARPELNKMMKKERDKLIYWITTIAVALLGIFITLILK